MSQAIVDQAIEFMQVRRYGEALSLFRSAIAEDPSQWNTHYMAGQCCRFLNDVPTAIDYLLAAARLKSDEPSIFLALGIAYQLSAQWDDAIEAFRQAITLDPDYELAYNSLALTQKKQGDLDSAVHNYDVGVKALTRRIIKEMSNSRLSPVLPHRDTEGSLWVEYAGYGALYVASLEDNIQTIAFPTAELALDEERTTTHAGLYWVDSRDDTGEIVRLYLPNYFNTFREALCRDSAYSNLIGNRGTVLDLLGRYEEAKQHFDEASEFSPVG